MEIIREGPSASRPPVLNGKNYSYWKPRMIFFIKTLDGKAWRALVVGYDPPMITVNGVSVPKPEVDWTDAEEQAYVGNARALNAIFNGVDLNVFKVLEIANESLLLGEKIPDSKIVRKVLRSLPRKFDMKVTAIEEAHDITTLKLDELFGSLLTFEMATADRESKKGKGIAFKFTHVNEEAVCDIEANMDELIALLTKQFTNALQSLKNPNATSMNVQTSNQYRRRNDNGPTRRNNENFDRRSDGYLKKKEDKESVDSRDDDGNINAFAIRITDENTDDDSECSVESKNDKLSIEKLETLWKEDCEARAIQKDRIQDLLEENERLMSVISSLKLKLREVQNENDQILKSVKMLNSGTKNLDSILKAEHNGSHRYGLGFVASASSSEATSEIKFVSASMRVEYDTIHSETGIRTPVKSLGRTCYYCGRKDDAWYFDSGCSRHMTGNRSYFTNLNDCVTRHVTLGDGAKGKIIAKGNIDKGDLPRLNDVRYVDGLKANLISISQLCDQGYKVSFDDIGYVVMNKENQICMSGKRQADNCYHWNSNMSDTCQLIRSDQTWLWHRKLGHVSMRGLEKIIKNKAVVGIPDLDVNGNFFCGDCQIGKQTRFTHKNLKECYTNRVLELLHMDLMGPMHAESLRGKRYVLVVVDDYSRYTWVCFLKRKTDTVETCKNLCLKLQREKGKKITRIRSDHANREYRQKWDARLEQGIFFGYSQNSRAYRVYNNRSDSVMETIIVVINDLDSAIKQMNDEEDETLNMSEVRTTSTVEES
ncbi:gag-pol polyprotein [Cucumis melo var. makuwa]|uniref:Gag-pol polyprotein n=1 Tax=Cucumis melo var. makuwa TaxID=1194695 RepID=A0A5D3D6G0_CUCMM|nr:gag-pol polyprotein [Cucumis melo var. makuwa]